ncbi:MAG: hypothetical protein QNL33_00685 [Akkermansiaceae bacterium]|jgi:hypothetical protein
MFLAEAQTSPVAVFIVAGLAIGGIIFGIPIARWLGERLGDVLSFLPTDKFSKTLPLISQGTALGMQGRLHEAAFVYEKLLKTHPGNLELYCHLLDLAFGPLNDHAYGEVLIKRGDKHLNQRGRNYLRLHRDSILTGRAYPLKHLGWRKDARSDHPEVAIPEALKGQFAQKS